MFLTAPYFYSLHFKNTLVTLCVTYLSHSEAALFMYESQGDVASKTSQRVDFVSAQHLSDCLRQRGADPTEEERAQREQRF